MCVHFISSSSREPPSVASANSICRSSESVSSFNRACHPVSLLIKTANAFLVWMAIKEVSVENQVNSRRAVSNAFQWWLRSQTENENFLGFLLRKTQQAMAWEERRKNEEERNEHNKPITEENDCANENFDTNGDFKVVDTKILSSLRIDFVFDVRLKWNSLSLWI